MAYNYQYIPNVEYEGVNPGSGIDAMLHEYNANKDYRLYLKIKKEIYKEMKLKQFAITGIAPDLIAILMYSPKRLQLILSLLADPYASFNELGNKVGLSKQRVYVILWEEAKKIPWLQSLLEMKQLKKRDIENDGKKDGQSI